MAPSLKGFDHVHVHVADRDAAERWYADVLGFTRVAELASWAEDGGPLTVANPSGSIHLALFERPAAPCRSVIAMAASAVEFLAWRRHLAERLGRSIEAVDHELSWSLYFTDPDGNPFEITSYEYATLAPELRGVNE